MQPETMKGRGKPPAVNKAPPRAGPMSIAVKRDEMIRPKAKPMACVGTTRSVIACEVGSLMPDISPSMKRLIAAQQMKGTVLSMPPASPNPEMKMACRKRVRCKRTQGSMLRMSQGARCDEIPRAIGWHANSTPTSSGDTPLFLATRGRKGASIQSRSSEAKPSTHVRTRKRYLVRLKSCHSAAISSGDCGAGSLVRGGMVASAR